MKFVRLKKILWKYNITTEGIDRNLLDILTNSNKINNINNTLKLLFNNNINNNHNNLISIIKNNPLILLENSNDLRNNIYYIKSLNIDFDISYFYNDISTLFIKNRLFKERLDFFKNKYSIDEVFENISCLKISKENFIKLEDEFNNLNFSELTNICLTSKNNYNFKINPKLIEFAKNNKIIINDNIFKYPFEQIALFQKYRNNDKKDKSLIEVAYINRDKLKKLMKKNPNAPKKIHRPYYILEMKDFKKRAIPIYSNPNKKYRNEIKIKDGEYGVLRIDHSFNIEEYEIVPIKYKSLTCFEEDIDMIKENGIIYEMAKYLHENPEYAETVEQKLLSIKHFEVENLIKK